MPALTVERSDRGVATVTMARPEVFNAFDEAMIAELDALRPATAAAGTRGSDGTDGFDGSGGERELVDA